MKYFAHHKTKGISSIEMLVGISLAALILIFVTHAVTRFVNVGLDIADKTQALYLAEEGLELVSFIRNDGWNNIDSLTDSTTYYLDVTPTNISTSTTPELLEGVFTRSFEVVSVERDGGDSIVTSGSADADSKYVEVTVSWGTPVKTVELTSMLANIANP